MNNKPQGFSYENNFKRKTKMIMLQTFAEKQTISYSRAYQLYAKGELNSKKEKGKIWIDAGNPYKIKKKNESVSWLNGKYPTPAEKRTKRLNINNPLYKK